MQKLMDGDNIFLLFSVFFFLFSKQKWALLTIGHFKMLIIKHAERQTNLCLFESIKTRENGKRGKRKGG